MLDLEDLSSLESSLSELEGMNQGKGDAASDPLAGPRGLGGDRRGPTQGKRDSEALSGVAATEEEDVPAFSLEDLDLEATDFGESVAVDGMTGLDEVDESEEVETKLDLARAYWEMGDGVGAREILQEVLAEGSDAQKTAARELMDQMA
jgi:pilus assembly protein FimV